MEQIFIRVKVPTLTTSDFDETCWGDVMRKTNPENFSLVFYVVLKKWVIKNWAILHHTSSKNCIFLYL